MSNVFPKGQSKVQNILIVLFIISLAGFGWSFFGYMKAKKQISYLSTPEGRAQIEKKEAAAVLDKVKKLILLPQEEEPVIATIQDADGLKKEQQFYADAQNGDKLLVYKEKAIIYSPARNVIVNVGPVIIQNQNGGETANQPAAKKITVEVRNGSGESGKARQAADALIATGRYDVVRVAEAAKNDYAKTVVVNVKGANVSEIERAYGITASALPEGEAATAAEVLIIVGN